MVAGTPTTASNVAFRVESIQSQSGGVREIAGRLQLLNPAVFYFAHDQSVGDQATITFDGHTFKVRWVDNVGEATPEKLVIVDRVK